MTTTTAAKSAFLAMCANVPRADLLDRIATFGGPAGRAAAEKMSDATIASVLWSLRALAT